MKSTIIALDISAITYIFYFRILKKLGLEDIDEITVEIINEAILSVNSFLAFTHFREYQIVPTKVIGLLDHKQQYQVPKFTESTAEILAEEFELIDGYWRTAYLQTPEVYMNVRRARAKDQGKPIYYKKGRKVKLGFKPFFKMVLELFHTAGIETFSFPGYEADDIAAAVAYLNKGLASYVVLVSTDKDWLPLVDLHNITWFCPLSLLLLNKNNVLRYLRDKVSKDILEAQHLWTIHKQRKGDSSDSLPCNSPVEVIDLLNPPSQHRLLNNPEYEADILRCLSGANRVDILDLI